MADLLPTDTDGNPVISLEIALELLDVEFPDDDDDDDDSKKLSDGDGTETRGQKPRTMSLS